MDAAQENDCPTIQCPLTTTQLRAIAAGEAVIVRQWGHEARIAHVSTYQDAGEIGMVASEDGRFSEIVPVED